MKKIALRTVFVFLLLPYLNFGQVITQCKSHISFLLEYEKDLEFGINYIEKYAIDLDSASFDVDGNELAFTFGAKPIISDSKVEVDGIEFTIDYSVPYFFDDTGFLGFDGNGIDFPKAKYDIKERFHRGQIEKWLPAFRSSVKRLICEDLKHVNELEIDLTVWNTNLESNVCKSTATFIGNAGCPEILIDRKLIGNVTNLNGDGIADVKIGLRSGLQYSEWYTQEDGGFELIPPLKSIYEIEASKAVSPLNGVSTLDLVLVFRHILGFEKLENIQLFAADYNSDSRVRTSDIVALRKALLGITTDEETSLLIIPENLQFEEVTHPLPDTNFVFDATKNMPAYRNYTAIKKGDVNGSSRYNAVNSEKSTDERTDNKIVFIIQNNRLVEGDKRMVAFNLDNEYNLAGLQFSLATQDVEVLGLSSKLPGFTDTHWSLHQDTLTVSWVNETGMAFAVPKGEIFELFIQAKANIELENALQLSPLPLEPQAYQDDDLEVYKIELFYNDSNVLKKEFSVKQNYPNPFREATIFEIFSPENSMTTIICYDLFGKLIFRKEILLVEGINFIDISKADLCNVGLGAIDRLRSNDPFENHQQNLLFCKFSQKGKTILKKMIHMP